MRGSPDVLLQDPAHDSSAHTGTRLHIREDPVLSESADGGVFGHLMQGAPGRIRTCAHGSGGPVASRQRSRSRACTQQIRRNESTDSPRLPAPS